MKIEKKCQCCDEQKQIEEELCVCDRCMESDRGKMIAIREILYENSDMTIGEICNQLNISRSDMNRFIEEGRITVKPRDVNNNESLRKIRDCIALHPEYMKYQVSATTGVQLETINKLIKEGRVIEKSGVLKVKERPNKDKIKRQFDIRELYKVGNINQTNYEESQLVIDLKELKKERDKKGER